MVNMVLTPGALTLRDEPRPEEEQMAKARKVAPKRAATKTPANKPSKLRKLLEKDLQQVDGAGCNCCLQRQRF